MLLLQMLKRVMLYNYAEFLPLPVFKKNMIPQFDKVSLGKLAALLLENKKIAIVPHAKPDGDAMGSSLAMYHYLLQKGHDVKVVIPTGYPGFLAWMDGKDQVVNFSKHAESAKSILANADIIFCLDFNSSDRVEKLEGDLLSSKAIKVMIDHHLSPGNFCDFTFSFSAASSTCELIYHFIVQMEDKTCISKSIAECLYTGIMTDTGSFRFSSMTADTHHIISELIEAGASNSKIHDLVFDNFTEERTRFLGYCLQQKLVVLREYNTAYISVSQDELAKFNHQPGDTEGIVGYGLGIKGIRCAAFFAQKNDLVKISFRSKDDFSVRDLASKHFEGGGHKNAAGGKSKMPLEDTIARFIAVLPLYKDQLTNT